MAWVFHRIMRSKILPFFGLLALFTLAPPSYGEDNGNQTPTIPVRAGIHETFERLVFDWPHTTKFTLHRDGNRVSIDFAAAGKADFRSALAVHLTHASAFSSAMKDGHLTASFTVDPQTVVQSFASDNSVVVDMRPGPKDAVAKTEPAPPKAVTGEPTPAAPDEKTPASPPTPPSPPSATPPSATPPSATPALSVTTSLATTSSATAPSVTAPSLQTSSAALPASSSSTATATPGAAPSLAAPPEAGSTPAAPIKSEAKPLIPTDIGMASQLVAALDPHVTARAVIYQRGGYGYIVFDRKFTLALDALTAGQPAPLVDLEPLDLAKVTGYRFLLPPDVEIHATRESTAWQIFLSKQHLDIPVSTSLVAQPDFALGARFLLPLPDAPDPIHLIDPVVGDALILIPLEQTEAFSVGRSMADFRILPAAQGLVLKPTNDKLVVHAVSDGIEITAEGGLHLSRALDTGAAQESVQKAKAAVAGKSMFDFAGWRGKPNETFTDTRQRLQQTIVDVPEAERNRARLELARFYFANGDGEEATALLHYLVVLVPDLATHADFLALYGASKILAYRPEDGLADFDNTLLAGQPEIELWQAVADAELRDWKTAEEKFSASMTVLAGYPEPFYSRFSVLAVESALAAGKDREGKDWLDLVENNPHRTEIDPAIEYLHGVIHSKEGRVQAAEDLWKEVKDSNDRLYRIRAELALIDLGVATGTLTPAKAADRLESLRFGWRGDDLEFDILRRLGEFYIQAKNIQAGLNILDQAIKLYPKSPLVPQVRNDMATAFRGVFLGDLAPNLSAVDALTLYQQYRDLMPSGSDGDAIMRNLAERLVSIDLLDQASGLLEELVKTHLKGVDKGRVGARLAAIRLLDHKPEAAIAALDISNDNSYPADLLSERLLLRAKALSEENKEDDAMELLKGENSRDAKILRADVSMHAQHWDDAGKNLLDVIGPPPQAGQTLNPREAEWLVSCAIAFSLANDTDGLSKLAIDYGAAMAGTTQNDTFQMLATQDKPMQLKDISAVQSKLSDVSLFQGFLNAYRTTPADKGDKAAKPAAETPAAPSAVTPAAATEAPKPDTTTKP
jgi:tetratricopeptide (TPR) repeat protein